MPVPVRFLYRDDDLVVVDKPAGLLVHRGYARDRDVFMTRVRDSVGCWVYPAHRLDRGASGAVVFALSKDIASELGTLFSEREVEKTYLALVRGNPPAGGTIDHPVPRRDGGERIDAVSSFECVERFGRYALVRVCPRTGRYHQIRRHLKHISCPLIGDVKYGKGEHNRLFREHYSLQRLALHALEIAFPHPRSGETLRVRAPLARDIDGALALLRAGDQSRRPMIATKS